MIAAHAAGSFNEFHARVARESTTSVPLGAYACDDDAHYLFAAPGGVYALSHRLDENRRLRAVSPILPALAWDEREMAQQRGIAFEGLPDERPLGLRDGAMPPAVIAHGEGLMHFVVGPVHAGIIEPGRFTFSSGGETVVHLDAQLGYAHRGVERDLEGADAVEAARRVARICGGCSASRSLAYALALERLAGAEVPEEVQLARLVFAELERIYNHLADLAASASGAGWNPGLTGGMNLKERAMRLCAQASGHRLLFDAVVPGGANVRDLDVSEAMHDLREDVVRYLVSLFGNASVVSRWTRSGTIPHETARLGGAVGPAHRASRGEIDLRALVPYGAYRALPPRVAHATAGDTLARCSVKRDELLDSFRLIEEALRPLARHRVAAPAPLSVPAGKTAVAVEGPRGAEIVAVHVGEGGRIERFHAISASYRNWPLVARAMEGNIVPDFPLVNKSFNLCYACADK